MPIDKYFCYSAGFLWLASGLLKMASLLFSPSFLKAEDPVFHLDPLSVTVVLSVVETAIGVVALFWKQIRLAIWLTAWLSTLFVAYHLILSLNGLHFPCMCVGNLLQSLPITASAANMVRDVVLAYFCVGSYAVLICNCSFNGRASKKPRNLSLLTKR